MQDEIQTEIYQLARQRVDKRNRQIYLLAANVLGMFLYLGVFVALDDAIPKNIGAFIAIVWVGLVGAHAMIFSVMQNRKDEIDREVERLRHAIYDQKPKRDPGSRLELTDDGELVDPDDRYGADEARQDSL